MVDAVFAPVFRYFDLLDGRVPATIFGGMDKVDAWRRALAMRDSVRHAVDADYQDRLMGHLRRAASLLAA